MQVPKIESKVVNTLTLGDYCCCSYGNSVRHLIVVEGVHVSEPKFVILDPSDQNERFFAKSAIFQTNLDFLILEVSVSVDLSSLVSISEFDAALGHIVLSQNGFWLIAWDAGEGKKRLFNLKDGKVTERRARLVLAARRWSINSIAPNGDTTVLHDFEVQS